MPQRNLINNYTRIISFDNDLEKSCFWKHFWKCHLHIKLLVYTLWKKMKKKLQKLLMRKKNSWRKLNWNSWTIIIYWMEMFSFQNDLLFFTSFFSFSCQLYAKKVLFLGQIFETEILMNLHALRSPIPENHIFSSWSGCVCYQHSLKINYNRDFKFGIQHLYYMQILLKTYCEIWSKTLNAGAHKIILIHYDLWTEFIISAFLYI